MTAAVIYAFSEISGAHVDPAVTIGFLTRRVVAPAMAAYILAQFVGAFVAAGLWLAYAGPAGLALGASHPGPEVSDNTAVIAEVVLTFVLMLIILMTLQEEPVVGKQAALAVGFTVAACGFVAGPLSGASMNPARTLAPQALSPFRTRVGVCDRSGSRRDARRPGARADLRTADIGRAQGGTRQASRGWARALSSSRV